MKRLVVAGFFCGLIALGLPNLVVWLGGRGATTDVDRVPHAQAALVLGAQVMPNGSPSSMLSDRITAAEELYKAGRVDKLLLSGDHGTVGYDEVGTMRRILLEHGIPPRDIFTDHAGFDTWDSAQRARRVFDVKSAVVVTQRFHMARALFDARRAGLQVSGFDADRRSYGRVMRRLQVREAAARVKTLGDAVTGADPRFLGPVIPITGDGRKSWGD
ncbi:MAG TPA: ElyC/SanA/YdcF family protein [Solirubrobacter sp.]|nr:ElyC/SanA/YdcF family protein [Solirubrobacter sp.]